MSYPLWRIWLPLILASVASSLVLARIGEGVRDASPPLHFSAVPLGSNADTAATPAASATPVVSTVGCGAVAFDADGDGAIDLYFADGGSWPWEETGGRSRHFAGRLMHNDGHGHFNDVTLAAGLTPTFRAMAAAACDFDGDGHLDLAVTGVGALALFRNRGDGTFEEIGQRAGIEENTSVWNLGATWLDVNADGRPDLIVIPYARWADEFALEEAIALSSEGPSYGSPSGLVGDLPRCYVNRGDGTFRLDRTVLDTTDPSTKRPRSWALAAIPLDANGDRTADLLVTFARGDPLLFVGRPEGGFRRVPLTSESGRDGFPYWNPRADTEGGSASEDARSQALLRWARGRPESEDGPAIDASAPGLAAFDTDGDGRIESLLPGSSMERTPGRDVSTLKLHGSPALLRLSGSSGWRVVDRALPTGMEGVTRSVAAADFDGDGSIDVVVSRFGAPPLLLKNDSPPASRWIGVELLGPRATPAWGARIEVHTPRGVLAHTHLPHHDGLGQSLAPTRFSLSNDTRVRKVLVLWPDGNRTEIREPALDRVLLIRSHTR